MGPLKYIFVILTFFSFQTLSGMTSDWIARYYDNAMQDSVVEVRLKPTKPLNRIGNVINPSYYVSGSPVWIGCIIDLSETYIILKVRPSDLFYGLSTHLFNSILLSLLSGYKFQSIN